MKYVLLSGRSYINSYASYGKAVMEMEILKEHGLRSLAIITYEQFKDGRY